MITAVIIAKNEEKNIKNCIDSVSFCNEIIVIDDLSTDNTCEIAKKNNAKIISHSLQNNFAAQRNYGLEIAKNNWVLYIDADEVVTGKLAKNIQSAVNENMADGFYLSRQDKMFGNVLKHGELKGKKFVRLAKKDAGKWEGKVHEEWRIEGKTKALSGVLMHYPHQTLFEFIEEINFYTTLRANELCKQGKRSSMFQIIFYTKAKFFQTYILKAGFLDGMPGLIYSLCMSLHSFLVRGKLYLLTKKK